MCGSPRHATTSELPPGRPRWSIVIPTFQRRDLVAANVRALADLDHHDDVEVIVVVDGSTDGTAAALRCLEVPLPLTVLEQANAGAAVARNTGARHARGDILLFLDDDMEAEPGLLREHEAAYAAGADAVMGHVPLHPSAPRNFLSRGVEEWAAARARRLESGVALTSADLLTGQLSVPRELFGRLGGFDESFTEGGSFGNEDTDFGRRLIDGGHRLVFAPRAVSRQHYVVSPAHYLRQWRQAGEADARYLRKHPGEAAEVLRARRPHERWNRFVWRPLTRVPPVSAAVSLAARQAVLMLASRRPDDPVTTTWFFRVRNLEYWRGVHAAGGFPSGHPLRILCYHGVSDLAGAPVLAEYGVPPHLLRRQLRTLRAAGFRYVTVDEALRFVTAGGGLPRRPLLVTFDDCYTDLLDNGVPVLTDERVPAVAFAVTGLVGSENAWDVAIGAPARPLLDADGLHALVRSGVEVGVHGRTHRVLTGLPDDDLREETAGAARDLVALGLPCPRVFSYPHGEHDEATRQAVAAAGLQAAFTVAPGVVRPGRVDRYGLARLEVMRSDGSGMRLLAKVMLARPVQPPPAVVRLLARAASRARVAANGRARPQDSARMTMCRRSTVWRIASRRSPTRRH